MTAGKTLAGRVVVAGTSEGIAGIRIFVNGGGSRASTQSGPDGAFELRGLAAGSCVVQAFHSSRADGDERELLLPLILQSVEVPNRDLRIEMKRGGRIRGTVLDAEGKPKPGAFVVAESRSDPADSRPTWQAQTGRDGRFTLVVPLDQKLDFTVDGPGGGRDGDQRSPLAEGVVGGAEEVVLRLRAAKSSAH